MTRKLFENLRSNFGLDCATLVSNRSALAKKLASWINHRVFNIRCLQSKIIPPSLVVKPPDGSIRSKTAAIVASRTFLRQRIHSCSVTLEDIRRRIQCLDNQLNIALPPEVLAEVSLFITERTKVTFEKCKLRQRRKFDQLLQRMKPNVLHEQRRRSKVLNTEKLVCNLSDRALTESELHLLQKGMNFNLARKPLTPREVIPVLEPAIAKLPLEQSEEARLRISNILKKQITTPSNLTANELAALNALKKDKSIHITKADKGNVTVVMNRKDYETKSLEHLSTGPYEVITKRKEAPTLNKTKLKVNRYLQEMKPKLGQSLWFVLAPKSNRPGRFFGLPKIHKPDIPIRPVVDYTTCGTYQLSKYLAAVLKSYQPMVVSHVNDSFDFLNKIQTVCLTDDEVAVSFDVKSLYTSIPISECLAYLFSILSADDFLSDKTPLSASDIRNGVEICLTTTFFTFQNVLYRQTDGVAMGCPTSAIVASLFLHHVESNAIQSFIHPPRIWLRYVDDVFAILSATHMQAFFDHLNSQCCNIQFTMETENELRTISFLDCSLSVSTSSTFSVGIHRKPTHSDRYLHYESAHPQFMKRAVVRTLVNRVKRLCTDECTQKEELERLDQVMQDNSYPKRLITQQISQANPRAQAQLNDRPLVSVGIPYRTGTSEAIRKILKDYDIGAYFRMDNTVQRHLVRAKDVIETQDMTNCVYEIRCADCPATYVGQTARQLQIRITEHKRHARFAPRNAVEYEKLERDSAIALHALESGHQIDFAGTRVLQSGFRSYAERLYYESLEINSHPTSVNRSGSAKLSAVWIGLTSQLNRPRLRTDHGSVTNCVNVSSGHIATSSTAISLNDQPAVTP